jgi:hypothetical protein
MSNTTAGTFFFRLPQPLPPLLLLLMLLLPFVRLLTWHRGVVDGDKEGGHAVATTPLVLRYRCCSRRRRRHTAREEAEERLHTAKAMATVALNVWRIA